jgi:hypothetical protein
MGSVSIQFYVPSLKGTCMSTSNETRKSLLPQHRKLIEDSGIEDRIICVRGYYSETTKSELGKLGFSYAQRVVPALVVPVWGINGQISVHQIRPDQPRSSRGKVVKYETPSGANLVIDVPPSVRDNVLTGTEPLFVTEGIRKADAAVSQGLTCIGLMGVYGWKHQDDFWATIPLEQRPVYIVFDSDIATNTNVARAAAGLFALLESMGAKPYVVTLTAKGNDKVGLDDFFAAGGSPIDLYAMAKAEPPTFQCRPNDQDSQKYESDDSGIYKVIHTDDGPIKRPITNFKARILSETVFTRFNELQRELDIEATVRGTTQVITVPADEFDRMAWPITRLGADAIIYPGSGAKDEVRAAIQMLSPNIRKLVGIDKLGWHHVKCGPVFVHAGGVIGQATAFRADSDVQKRPADNSLPHHRLGVKGTMGTISQEEEDALGIRMRIPKSLGRYCLPLPSTGRQLQEDIRESMKLLTLAPSRISVPIYCAIWYAAFAEADFSIHLYGTTGVFKSEYAALATQHFGPGIDARHFPANWSSTPNYIRAMSAHAGNVILPVDDFVPTGSQYDIERSNRAAEDVFRSQGNSAGRGRCFRDGSPQETEQPKCLILSTGEVRPSGHSLTSRVLTLEVNPGDIADRQNVDSMKALTQAQHVAKSGIYSRVMSAFIQWAAMDFDKNRQALIDQTNAFRSLFAPNCQHGRTADAAAKLLAGLDLFLDFALTVGAIDEERFQSIWEMAHDGLFEVLETQDRDQADESPVNRFLELLRTALATGRAHLTYILSPAEEENAFGSPTYFGYQERTVTEPKTPSDTTDQPEKPANPDESSKQPEPMAVEYKIVFTPQGQRIGWKKLDALYFEPKEALAVVQRLAKDMHQPPIPMNHKALGKRLAERGLLVKSRKDRNVARVNIDGRKEDVFHIRLDDFMEIERNEGDFIDDRNEEAFRDREQAAHRQEQAARMRRDRRDQVNDVKQRELVDWLNGILG